MAKLKNLGAAGGNRRPAVARTYVIDEWRGVIRVRRKTQKHPKPKSDRHLDAIETFRQLAEASKRITPEEYEFAVTASKKTQYLWRDLVFMALSGRLLWFTDQDGNRIMSLPSRATMSESLDALGTQEYGLLIRAPDFWDVLTPGDLGFVLISGGPGQAPTWGPLPSAGGGKCFATVGRGSIGSTNAATKGNVVWPYLDINIQSLSVRAGWISGAAYDVRIFEWTGTQLGALLAQSASYVAPASATQIVHFPLPAPVPVAAGVPVAMMCTRTSSSGTTNCRLTYTEDEIEGWPASQNTVSFGLTDNDPQPGDTPSLAPQFTSSIGIEFTT